MQTNRLANRRETEGERERGLCDPDRLPLDNSLHNQTACEEQRATGCLELIKRWLVSYSGSVWKLECQGDSAEEVALMPKGPKLLHGVSHSLLVNATVVWSTWIIPCPSPAPLSLPPSPPLQSHTTNTPNLYSHL